MTVDETIKQLIAQRDSAIYRLIDYRISKGEWKLEDREQHFAEMLAVCERAEHKVFGPDWMLQHGAFREWTTRPYLISPSSFGPMSYPCLRLLHLASVR